MTNKGDKENTGMENSYWRSFAEYFNDASVKEQMKYLKNSVPVTQFEVEKVDRPANDNMLLHLIDYLELFNKIYNDPNVGRYKVSDTLVKLQPFDKWLATQEVKIKVNKNANQTLHVIDNYSRFG